MKSTITPEFVTYMINKLHLYCTFLCCYGKLLDLQLLVEYPCELVIEKPEILHSEIMFLGIYCIYK